MDQVSHSKRAKERMRPTQVGAEVLRLTGWGEVVSVFSGAVNARHSQGLLVSFVEEARAMTCLSVCVPSFFRKQKKRLVPGARVRFDGHRLVMKDFIVDLWGRPIWQGTLAREDVKGVTATKISFLKEALLLEGREGGFLGLLRGGEANNPFVTMAMKALSGFPSAPSQAAKLKVLSGLVGLGPGSTPSGDDFIAGVLLGDAALNLLRSEKAKAVADRQDTMVPLSKEKEDLWLALDRTNDAGKTLLWQALQGHFPRYLIEAVRSVSDAEGKWRIVDTVRKAIGRGATSGTDALTGFLFSMEGRV